MVAHPTRGRVGLGGQIVEVGVGPEVDRDAGVGVAEVRQTQLLEILQPRTHLVEPFGQQELAVASAVDLGLMKLGAIISRGSRRDFVDLHLLCRELPLAELLLRAEEKFGHVGDFALQAMKGLADTGAAAGEPMPGLAAELDWQAVEAWISTEVEAAGRELLPPP